MISGRVSAAGDATVPLTLIRPDGIRQGIVAIIDTGFTGYLTLPPQLIAALNLPFIRQSRIVLGDGSIGRFSYHELTFDWHGAARRIPVASANIDPLIGMDLLAGYRLTVEVVPRGRVTIEALLPAVGP